MVTVNDVRYSVSAKLEELYSNIPIHGEEIVQELVEPSFYVKLYLVTQNRELGYRYKRYHSFDIHYYPESKTEANDEMHAMADSLYDGMEYIEVNSGVLRGHSTKHEIIDGVLHFYIDYDLHLMRPRREEPTMQTMEQEGYIK